MKNTKEWNVEMPWGKVAMVSWGESHKPPVLLVHGYVDSAATFIPMLEHLPDEFYYVTFDIPGHGKSDQFPPGLSVSQIYIIEVIRRVVESLRWKKFIYIGHSMAAVIGLFYNYVYPNRMTKMILLDPGPALAMYHFVHYKPNIWYSYLFHEYYSNYDRYNTKKPKLYRYEDAVTLSASNRNLNVEQAEVILSRSLEIEGDKYRFSMDPRMKFLTNIPTSRETIAKAITSNKLPTLIIEASRNNSIEPGTSFASNLLQESTGASNYSRVIIDGEHDLHVTNPQEAAKYVKRFLNDKICGAKSLLCKI